MVSAISLIAFVAAPFIGSFLGVLVLRSGDGRPVIVGRSQCDHCQHRLAWRDLVPVVSWSLLGRRCRYCRAQLSLFYPLIEIAAIILVAWAATVMTGWLFLASAVLGWMLLALGLIDWRTQRLPDPLTFSLVAAGLVAAYFLERQNFVGHLIGAAVGYASFAGVAYVYHAIKGYQGLGLGDAKLLAALGAWLSWQRLPVLVVLAAVMCLSFILARALRRSKFIATERVPFGPFLALAGWAIWLYGPLLPF